VARWCSIKLRLDCQECGSSIRVDGPHAEVTCEACGGRLELTDKWQNVVEHALHHGKGGRDYRRVAAIDSGVDGLGMRYMALNKGLPPVCSECDKAMGGAADAVTDGTEGSFQCNKCGAPHPTWPAPKFLKQAGVRQVFMAPPEEHGAEEAAARPAPKPVTFQCPTCGAPLAIDGDTKRICTCEFCQSDTFLPASLWNQLHPVRMRRAFWLRLK